jgi:hypothetical protein
MTDLAEIATLYAGLANMPEPKKAFASGDPSYELRDGFDVDLAPSGKGVTDALREAINLINKHTGLSLALNDFEQKIYAIAYFANYTSKNEPVAWLCDKEGKRDGEKGVWHVEMSMDDPTVIKGGKTQGPKSPHIGYDFYFLSQSGRKSAKETGHVFLKNVPSSRPRPSEARLNPSSKNRT